MVVIKEWSRRNFGHRSNKTIEMTRLVEVFFQLCLRSVSEFFGVQKIMERFFNLFSFIASDNYRDSNLKKLKGANLFQINFTSNQLWLTLNWTFCSVWLQLTRYQPISILILFAYISCLHILIVFLLGSWIRCQENMQMSLNNTCPPVYQLYIVFS